MRPIVVTTKHINQNTPTTAASGVRINITLIDAVAVADVDTPSEVQEGSVVSAIYIESWVNANSTTPGACVYVIEKISGSGTPSINAGQMAALMTYQNKKNILFTFVGLTNSNATAAIPVMKGWLKIPKGKQRFGLGDKLVLSLLGQVSDAKICGFSIFKEQR